MKLTARADVFKKVVSKAADAIPQKSPEPAFMNFLLTVTDGAFEILASDGTITLKTKVSGKDEKGNDLVIASEPGKIQIPAKMLIDTVTKMVGDTVSLTLTDDSILLLSGGTTQYNLNTAPGAEYPDIDMSFDPSASITVSGEQFLSLFQSTSFAVATRSTKQCFTGINIKTLGGALSFLATDACRLAQKTVHIENAPDVEFTVPVKVLAMIAKSEKLKEVKFELGEGKALFLVGDTIYQTRLYNGEFPSPDRIKPTNTPYTLTVDSNEFSAALDRVSVITLGDPSPLAKLICSPEGVDLIAKSQAYGAAKERLTNAKFSGDLFEIGFNVRYVTDVLKALGSKEVTLAFAGEGKLFMIENGDDSVVQIITPIRSNM